MTYKSISILGCGWLGLPLAQHLVSLGYSVKGSTTTPEKQALLKARNVSPYVINFKPNSDENDCQDFFGSDVLFLNIPFKRSLIHPEDYKKQIESVTSRAQSSEMKFLIFASSTSVYPESIGKATEKTKFSPDQPRSKVLFEVEQALLKHSGFKTTIIRFAGLFGENRRIGQFLSDRKSTKPKDAPVNLIHLEDCVAIVTKIIQENITGEIFNACSDKHPKREKLYHQAAIKCGMDAPEFSGFKLPQYKIVSNTKLKNVLNYRFKHPDPLKYILNE